MGATRRFEIEVLDGVGPFLLDELAGRPGIELVDAWPTAIRVEGDGSAFSTLTRLRTAVAVFLVSHFDIARPKALLGDQNARCLGEAIDDVRARSSASFSSFRLNAAGRDSSVFVRLAGELETRTGLVHDAEDGDLVIRVRPSQVEASGWDVLLRTTPRPLSARPWRVANYRGALNATIAAAMVELSQPTPDDRVFNPMCGSGTLLIERLARNTPRRICGCDIDATALDATTENLAATTFASRVRDAVELSSDDATSMPHVPDDTFDRVLVDLPWGTLVGNHEDNASMYPAFLDELARVTTSDARAVALTHEIKLFERLLDGHPEWTVAEQHRFFQKGHHPRAFVLERTGS